MYNDVDVGCKVRDIRRCRRDPLGDPANNGYCYRSDGTTCIYAQLEDDIGADQECKVEKPGLSSRENLICIGTP